MVAKTLDEKLASIRRDPSCRDFILADAKDADMAGGMAAPGKSPEHHSDEGRFRTLAAYREQIRTNVRQGLVDIMLMSASTSEILTLGERLFDHSRITPACRANDTTDIWLAQGGSYPSTPSRPFRTATIDHMMCGKVACASDERKAGVDLGLYSVTFNNDTELDHETLSRYRDFRLEAEAKGFRHFLEVFDPNALQAPVADLGRFINDQIARALAGVTGKGRPVFLKIAYQGPAAMEQLVSYDPNLVVGILGGSSGTTYDAFHQLCEARQHGAKAALYGRMINNAEHQTTFIQHLRWLADAELDDPAEAVRSYHGELQKLGIQPYRKLEDDLAATLRGSSYSETSKTVVAKPAAATSPSAASTNGSSRAGGTNDDPDFSSMSPSEKVRWNLARWDRVLGNTRAPR